MATLASLLVRLGVDTRDVKSSLDRGTRDAEASGRKTGRKYSSGFGREIGAGVVAGLAVAWGQATFRALGEIEKLRRQTETTLKSMNVAWTDVKGIEAYAASIEKVTGVEAETVQMGQNLLLTFGNIKNVVGDGNQIFDRATAAAVDMSVALGQDMKSSAVQLGKALNDPIAGVSALQRVGVSFTAAQKDQIKALVESGDVMGAQKLILKELEAQFGGSAKAFGETMPGQLAKARNQFGELSENLVANLLPALNTLMQFGLANMGWLVPAAGVILALVVAVKLATFAQMAWNLAMMLNPIGLVVLAVVALVAVIVLIATKTRFFQTLWGAVWGSVKNIAMSVWGSLRTMPDQIGNAFAKVAGFISAPFRAAFNLVSRAWNNTVGRLRWTVPGWVPGFGGNSISAPQLPTFHAGGIVPGPPGAEMLALLQAGEQVIPARGGAPVVIEIRSGGSRLDEVLIDLLARAIQVRGGNAGLVLAGRSGR